MPPLPGKFGGSGDDQAEIRTRPHWFALGNNPA